MTRRSTAVAALAVTAGLLGAAGCGVPLDDQPRAISQTTIARVDATPTTAAPSDGPTVTAYYLADDGLQAEELPVEGEITLGKALDLVLAAPPEGETELRTSVPPGTALRGVQVAGGEATIDLSGEMNAIAGSAQKEAFAQIVFTALGFDEVQQVRFLIDGKAIDTPTDNGNLAVVTADDYDPPLNPR